ncbi:MAG: hypothetical protein ACJ8EN_09660, partial [Xanthobacteraceae bacterium]
MSIGLLLVHVRHRLSGHCPNQRSKYHERGEAACHRRAPAKGFLDMERWLGSALDYIPRWIEFQMRTSQQ